MHADKTALHLNQVLNWNLLTAARIWYSRYFSIRIKRASASKPCKKHTLSQSSTNKSSNNKFSSGLDQGDNRSSNWATTPPPTPGSHTWGGTSAGKLFSQGSVCSPQPTKSYYPRVILPLFPPCFYEEPAEMSFLWESIFSFFKPKGPLLVCSCDGSTSTTHMEASADLITNENELSGCRNKIECAVLGLAWKGDMVYD